MARQHFHKLYESECQFASQHKMAIQTLKYFVFGTFKDLVQRRITSLHFLRSSFQNLIFCEISWLTSRNIFIYFNLKFFFYLQKELVFLFNYVAL